MKENWDMELQPVRQVSKRLNLTEFTIMFCIHIWLCHYSNSKYLKFAITQAFYQIANKLLPFCVHMCAFTLEGHWVLKRIKKNLLPLPNHYISTYKNVLSIIMDEPSSFLSLGEGPHTIKGHPFYMDHITEISIGSKLFRYCVCQKGRFYVLRNPHSEAIGMT